MSPKKNRVIIYVRSSSENQHDRSIDDQLRACREHIREDDVVVDVITDHAPSRAATARHGFDRLLKLIEARDVDVIRTESTDRLSRDLGDSDRLRKLCKSCNVRLHCTSDGIDDYNDNRGSRLQYGTKALSAAEEA